jgi:hypothetical protein
MAIVVSHLHSSMRGSIAGVTYLTTPAGQIIARQRTRPVQSTSPGSVAAKDALIQSVAGWNALTAAQKLAWNNWASANGDLSGREEYIAGHCLMNYGILTEPPIWVAPNVQEYAPTFTGHPAFTLSAVPFTTNGTGVAFQVQNASPYIAVAFIEISPQLSTGRNYWKGPWDTSMNQSDGLIIAEKHKFEFTGLVSGYRYYARARIVSNGITVPYVGTAASPALITFSTAVTNPV